MFYLFIIDISVIKNFLKAVCFVISLYCFKGKHFLFVLSYLSTSFGLMTDRIARLRNVGGEVLFYIW